ncbi:hypothetical protein [Kitasatospora sp. NPDC127116]|uniref:hypothetical protein n=1 Tax=Kitasatospora sp. NPDC127116 TaxID=3345367 RepID=UPI00362CF482
MTVLHSRNADAADPADVADAADVKDPQDAAAEPDLREDLGRYAELGAFTLTAETHAWYAAVDTVATPEDARAASTALAELRGSDLQQTWEAVTALAADVKLDEPDTVAKTALLVEMLQRVHRTSTALFPAAYDADLGALAAATADSTWRRENGVKLSWLRGRSLRKQAVALATDRRIRREDLHEALTSAEIERRAWAALAPAGTLPRVPGDAALVDRTAQAFEAINTGLRGLARLLPDHDLDGLPFAELIDLVERLAADEGTLYRLPTIRGLRVGLEEAGLADLLAELAAAKADRRAAEAAYTARQALVAGQRDGLGEKATATGDAAIEEQPEAEDAAEATDEVAPEAAAEVDGEAGAEEVVAEKAGTEESADLADAEAAALQALAGGQRDGLGEKAPAPATAPAEEADEAATAPAAAEAEAEVEAEVKPEVETETATEAKAETETEVEAEAEIKPEVEADAEVEAETPSDTGVVAEEPATEQADEEAQAAVVTLPAPSPAADDLMAAATAALAEAVDETPAETEPEADPAAEVVEAVEVEEPAAEVVAEEPVAEVAAEAETVVEVAPVAETEPEPVVTEPEVTEPAVEEPTAEVIDVVEAEANVVEEPAAETDAPAIETAESAAEVAAEAEVEVEPVAVAVEPTVDEPAVEVDEPAVEAEAEAEAETAEAVVAEAAAEPEPVTEPEPAVEVAAEPEPEAVAVEAAEPVVEAEEPAVAPEPEPAVEVAAEPEPVAAAEAPAAEPEADVRPVKPDFTPGRPVTAYSADELLAVVRWVDGDGVERTDEELLRAAMKELGFARLGPRIKEALGAAVTAARG